MQLSSHVVICILLASIVSVVTVGPKTHSISSLLSENIVTKNSSTDTSSTAYQFNENSEYTLVNTNQHSHSYQYKTSQSPQIKVNQATDTLSNNDLLKTNISNKRFFINSPIILSEGLSKNSAKMPKVAGIDGTGGTQPTPNTGIDGTGGTQPTPDTAGIDGTGGTQPTPDTGIDGTGGTQPTPDNGIDGTGGPSTELVDEPKNEPKKQPEPQCDSTACSETPPECDSAVCHDEPQAIVPSISVQGTLQRFGNYLRINGHNFRITDTTQTTINGKKEADIAQLSNAQVVTVIGGTDKDNTLIAQDVIYHTSVSGNITNVAQHSVTVLGQTIVLHKDIIFTGTATQLSDLTVGDTINVSGFRLSNGELSATRIERVDNQTNRLTGVITGLNESEKIFEVNNLTINYEETLISNVLENGQTVHLKGEVNSQDSLIFNANTVDIAESVLDTPVEKIEIEGFITQFTSPEDFSIGNVEIFTDLQTQLIGNERDDLGLNTKIEVEGYINSDNVLVAERILFLVANLTSHKDGTRFSSTTQTFEWNDVGAQAYRLHISNRNITDISFYDRTFDSHTTSITVSGLPKNSAPVLVELYTLQDGFWSRKLYDFSGSGDISSAKLTSHKHLDKLGSTTIDFTWSTAPEAEAYRLKVFNYHSPSIIYHDQTFTEPESVTVDQLPDNGADINVHLYTLQNGWWSRRHYDLISLQLYNPAKLTSHIDKQQLTSATETFTWNDVGAEEYELRLLSKGKNRTIPLDGSITSITLDDLPINGAPISIWLRTKQSGWAREKYQFYGASLVQPPELTSHKNKEQLSSSTQTFSWTQTPDVEEYHLQIIHHSVDDFIRFSEDYDPFITSATIHNLPQNSAKLEFSLSYKHNGYWAEKSYILEGTGELDDAEITSHTTYQKIKGSSTTITWSDANAEAYRLKVTEFSNTSRKVLHKQIYDKNTLSVTVDNLPTDTLLYIEVGTNHNNWWGYRNVVVKTMNVP